MKPMPSWSVTARSLSTKIASELGRVFAQFFKGENFI